LQNTVDGFKDMEALLSKEGIDYKDSTIYEFFFLLNRELKPKKKNKNG